MDYKMLFGCLIFLIIVPRPGYGVSPPVSTIVLGSTTDTSSPNYTASTTKSSVSTPTTNISQQLLSSIDALPFSNSTFSHTPPTTSNTIPTPTPSLFPSNVSLSSSLIHTSTVKHSVVLSVSVSTSKTPFVGFVATSSVTLNTSTKFPTSTTMPITNPTAQTTIATTQNTTSKTSITNPTTQTNSTTTLNDITTTSIISPITQTTTTTTPIPNPTTQITITITAPIPDPTKQTTTTAPIFSPTTQTTSTTTQTTTTILNAVTTTRIIDATRHPTTSTTSTPNLTLLPTTITILGVTPTTHTTTPTKSTTNQLTTSYNTVELNSVTSTAKLTDAVTPSLGDSLSTTKTTPFTTSTTESTGLLSTVVMVTPAVSSTKSSSIISHTTTKQPTSNPTVITTTELTEPPTSEPVPTTKPTSVKPTTEESTPPISSKSFKVYASVAQEWNEKFAFPYTTEHKELKKNLEDVLTSELHTLDGFIELIVLDEFSKGSVRFQFKVYFHQSSSVNEESLSTKVQYTNTSIVGAMEVIKVENEEDNASASQSKSKPFLELWMIVVIAAGGVILIYTIILIVLLVKMNRLKRVLTLRSKSQSHVGEEDVSFFNMKLVNNHQAETDADAEPFIWRATTGSDRPELQTFTSINEASSVAKAVDDESPENENGSGSPVMKFEASSDKSDSASTGEAKEKYDDSKSSDRDGDADDEEDGDEEKKKKEEPTTDQLDKLVVDGDTNVSPFY